jgi:hypothetical protein
MMMIALAAHHAEGLVDPNLRYKKTVTGSDSVQIQKISI